MSSQTNIDVALAKLEAGRFSFQMVDAIKDHIARIENELQTTRSLHAEAVEDLQRQEYAVWRLESEVQKLNAKIHGLIRSNLMVERADRAAVVAMAKTAEYAVFSRNYALATARRVADELPSLLAEAKAKARDLQAEIFNEKTAAEFERYVGKAMETFEAAKKQAHVIVDRAVAYLSTLHKTAA